MSGRIVCFGEVLLRLSAPEGERLLQSPLFDARVGGAEANVAVSLARLGHVSRLVTVLPDNVLGRAARDEVRRHGVDTRGVSFTGGRMGLYFVSPGAGVRPATVTYDRIASAFALADGQAMDWTAALQGGDWLHVSGVTPAVSAGAEQAALHAVRAARAQGVKVSFDGNYRSTLWARRGTDGASALRPLLECADLAFVDDRDVALLLGGRFNDDSAEQRAHSAAAVAFEACPHLQRVALTIRTVLSTDDHELSALLFTRDAEHHAGPVRLARIVDRIGAGDAFAAGVLHGLIEGLGDAASLEFGLAAAALKHSARGDFNLADDAEVEALRSDGGFDVRR